MEVLSLVWAGLVWELVWESPFREDSGLPTLALAFALTHTFFAHVFNSLLSLLTHLLTPTLPPIPSHPHRFHPTLRPTPHSPLPPLPAPPPPIPHTPCCCCYAAERTSFSRAARFRAGTLAKRSTPRKLRGKLRGSSAHQQLRSTLQKLVRSPIQCFFPLVT